MIRAVVVGSGAIGSLFGFRLASGGHDVWMVDKNEQSAALIGESGLCVMDGQQEKRVKVKATSDPNEIKICDLVILCVKSFHTAEAVRAIAHLITGEVPLLTIQTGLGNVEAAGSVIPPTNILGGVTFQGATLLSPGRVVHSGAGDTVIGEIDGKETPRVRNIVNALHESGISAEMSRNIGGYIWSKVIIYAGINPLTAMLRLKNGQLLEDEETTHLLKAVIDEGMEVARAHGVKLVYEDPFEVLFSVCRKTSDNLSPMFQDVLSGKKTEIDSLNGNIVKLGENLGVKAPVNMAMTNLVKVMEKRCRRKS